MHTSSLKAALPLFFFIVLLAVPEEGDALIWRSDKPASQFDLDESLFPAVFYFYGPDKTRKGECSATLIDSQWALTAAHCLQNPSTKQPWTWADGNFDVLINGVTHKVDKTFRNACFDFQADGPNNADLALLHLETASTVTPYPLYTGTAEVGSTFTMVGWGDYSPASSTQPGMCKETAGGCTFRGGQNVFSAVDGNTLKYSLSDPDGDDDNVNENEVIGYTGDSGGPGFLTEGSTTYLAGINSGGACCAYGSVDQMVRVSSQWSQTWITKTIEDGESYASDCSAVAETAANMIQKLNDASRNGPKKANKAVPEKEFTETFTETEKAEKAEKEPKFTMQAHEKVVSNPIAGWGRRRGLEKGPKAKKGSNEYLKLPKIVKKAVTGVKNARNAVFPKPKWAGKKRKKSAAWQKKHDARMAKAKKWRRKWRASIANGGSREIKLKKNRKSAAEHYTSYIEKRKKFIIKLRQYLKNHPKKEKTWKAKRKAIRAKKAHFLKRIKQRRAAFYKKHPHAEKRWKTSKAAHKARRSKGKGGKRL